MGGNPQSGANAADAVINKDATDDYITVKADERGIIIKVAGRPKPPPASLTVKSRYSRAVICEIFINFVNAYLINEIETLINPCGDKVDGTSSECQTRLRADAKIGGEYGLSRDKVAKYIRISTLAPALLTYVDSGRIPFLSAYEVSFVEDKDD